MTTWGRTRRSPPRCSPQADHRVLRGRIGSPLRRREALQVAVEGPEIVVARLAVDLRGYDGADVEVETPEGRPIKTFRDVACDPTDGALYAVCQEPLARIAFDHRITARVIATRAGKRETVAVFDVHPTP